MASVPNAATVNPNGIKMFLANVVSTLFINDKPAVINGLRKLRNPCSWLIILLVVLYIKLLYFLRA